MSVRSCPTCYSPSPIWLEACSHDALVDFYRCAPCQTVWHIPKFRPTAAPTIIGLQRNGIIALPVECWSCGQPVVLEVSDVLRATPETAQPRAAGESDRDRRRWSCPWCEFRNLGGTASRVISASRGATVLR